VKIQTHSGVHVADSPQGWLARYLDAQGHARRALIAALPLRPSGGWRRSLVDALGATRSKFERRKLQRRLAAMDPVNAWNPRAIYTCPACGHQGHAERDFGARMALRLDIPASDAPKVIGRALELVSDRIRDGANPPRVVGPGSVPGTVRVLLPVRQSQCRGCRRPAR